MSGMIPGSFALWYLASGMYAAGHLDERGLPSSQVDFFSNDFAQQMAERYERVHVREGDAAIQSEWLWYIEALEQLEAERNRK